MPLSYGDTTQAALDVLRGPRDAVRGDPLPIYQKAADIFTAWTGTPFTAEDMFRALIAVKLAREVIGKLDTDNYVDAIGYLDFLRYAREPGTPESL